MRCFCRVEYDGAAYAGWQIQRDEPTIQSRLEAAFSTVVRQPCAVTGAGRTDAGVHARGQGMHIDLPDGSDLRRCARSVNAVLPRDIAIYDLRTVADFFHARFSAIRRRYKYYFVARKTPLLYHRAMTVSPRVDWDRVNEAIPSLLGTHDFASFCSAGSSTETTVCTVFSAGLDREDAMRIFTITADRFLYNMVRSIVGTLLHIGAGKTPLSLAAVIAAKDRSCAGETAPPWGLVLDYVEYPEGE